MNPTNPPTSYYAHAIVSYRFTERYDEALRITKEMLSRWPNSIPGHVHLVWIYMALGRDDEAREVGRDLLRLDPKFSAQRYVSTLPFKDKSQAGRYVEILRKAGLQE